MNSDNASASNRPTRILIVDDHPIVRQGYHRALDRESDLEICGEAEDAPEAMRLVREIHPDLVLIDLSLKEGSGTDLIKQIHHFDGKIRMLVCSVHDEAIHAERVIRAGAGGYVRKDEPIANLVQAIKKVRDGEIYLSGQMVNRVLSRVAGREELNQPTWEKLTDRELEVVQLIGQGRTTRQIADKLHLSVKTIETYRESVKSKLNLQSGTELSYWAVQWVNQPA